MHILSDCALQAGGTVLHTCRHGEGGCFRLRRAGSSMTTKEPLAEPVRKALVALCADLGLPRVCVESGVSLPTMRKAVAARELTVTPRVKIARLLARAGYLSENP